MSRLIRTTLPLLAVLLFAVPASQAATVSIVSMDGVGEGFNDPSTPNPAMACPAGMTLGQCRLNAAQAAAQVWADSLVSVVEVRVWASFDPIACGILGQSTRLDPVRDFPGAPLTNTWYHRPLADALSGTDRNPGLPDLLLAYNSNYDNGVCSGGPWYYGVDGNPGSTVTTPLFFPVILHEMAHGFGFASFVNYSTGSWFAGLPYPDIYSYFIYDTTVGLHWTEMTAAQRVASAINTQQVVWDGPETKIEADNFLTGNNVNLIVNSGPAAGTYAGRGALFGAPYTSTDGVTLDMEVVNDGGGVSPTDGCEPLVGFTPGRIAFIDRGDCEFGLKSLNAEQAGAGGVIIADNAVSPPFQMAPGTYGRQVTIPVIYITQADGNLIRVTLPVSGTFDVLDVNGMHATGFPMLYTPNPVVGGSTISHFDDLAGPNALMEWALGSDIWDDLDMTPGVFRDEGWVIVPLGGIFADDFETGSSSAWSVTVP